MTTKLLKVAEGILDSAAEEHRESNLSSIDTVKDYAEFGCDIHLSDDEAKLILETCKAWLNSEPTCGADYYYSVEKPLLGDEATI